jgi:hypothetical protein
MLDSGRKTVRELHEAWWTYAEANLATKSREIYDGAWKTHLPRG